MQETILAAKAALEVNSGDTAWVLASASLVLLMTPALAFFYGGMVRAKHVLGMLMQNFAAIAIVSITWVVIGFSLAFSGNNGLVGDLHFFGLANMGDAPTGTESFLTIPTLAFVAFQATFAIITLALITGATADRWRFGAFVVFGTIWSVLVYSTVAHWVFSPGGWLFKLGALDFAGGTVVHINAGAAGLAMALVLGKRRGWPKTSMRGHNIPFVMLGAGLLWFGWFGFNAGSALTAGNLASYAWVNTNTATAAALIGWIVVEKLTFGSSTALGAASGAVAGLVAITPCAGFVTPLASIAIGLGAGVVCAFAIRMKNKLGFDDSLDVVGVHLVGGIFGALCVGLFATATANSAVTSPGLFVGGDASLLGKQAIAVVSVLVFSFVVSYILGKLISLAMKDRVDEETEEIGLDQGVHGESAYEFGPIGGLGSGVIASTTPAHSHQKAEVDA